MSKKKSEKNEKNSMGTPTTKLPEKVEIDVTGTTKDVMGIPKAENVDSILDDVVGTQKPVDTEPLNQPDEIKDSADNYFNPEIHSTDKDGSPSVTSTGKYRMKKGRKDTTIDDEQKSRQTAAVASTNLFISIGVALFGDEWQPVTTSEFNEHLHLITAFDNYYASAGIISIPPSIALIVATGTYAIVRIPKPTTKKRLKIVKDSIVSKIKSLWPFNRSKKSIPKITKDVKTKSEQKDDYLQDA